MNSKSRSWLWWGMTSNSNHKLVRFLNREEKTHSEEVGYDRVVVHICQISTSLYLNLSTFNGHSWMVWMATHWTDRSYLGKAKCKMKRQFHHLGDVWFIKVVSKVCIFEYKIWYFRFPTSTFISPKIMKWSFVLNVSDFWMGFRSILKEAHFGRRLAIFSLRTDPPTNMETLGLLKDHQ